MYSKCYTAVHCVAYCWGKEGQKQVLNAMEITKIFVKDLNENANSCTFLAFYNSEDSIFLVYPLSSQ